MYYFKCNYYLTMFNINPQWRSLIPDLSQIMVCLCILYFINIVKMDLFLKLIEIVSIIFNFSSYNIQVIKPKYDNNISYIYIYIYIYIYFYVCVYVLRCVYVILRTDEVLLFNLNKLII